MRELGLVLFAITAGFTLSGITASLYRLCGLKANTSGERTFRFAVMTVAGPSVVFESAVKGLLAKKWTRGAFWLAVTGVAYWSLALGLFVIELGIAFSA